MPSMSLSMRKASFKAMWFIGIAALLPPPALAGNFATCLLDKLPAVQNDIAANAAFQACTGTFPGGFASVPQGAGRGWFGYRTGADCTLAKAGDTRSNRAAVLIGLACRKLYDLDLIYDPNWTPPPKP